ncbi:MAG TPA: rhamnogalacturonan acetylesterase [Pyrinomonadaceae bacterium]|nr:rhamnogalacturonan acetylesterase [Pyrinomonadaceae bacterium]
MNSGQWKTDNVWTLAFALLLIAGLDTNAFGQRESVTIFLAGDSTMAAKLSEKRPETGWGEKLEAHFKPGTVKVDNRAANGRSTKTFISEGKWQSIIDDLSKGDYVFIQFGHNDSSKDKGERFTPPEDYRKNLIRFVEEVRAKGGEPVLFTPVVRRRFDKDGKFFDTHGEYPNIVRSVAAELSVSLIDMHRSSEALVAGLGIEGSRKLFLQLKAGENMNYPNGIDDNTHFSPYGAEEIAKLAVVDIQESKLGVRKLLIK